MRDQPTIIVWFRRDLRICDHPALAGAIATQANIIPLFIFSPYLLEHPETGSGRVQFMLRCLDSLQKNLEHLGSTLIRRHGDQAEELAKLSQEVGADAVYWNDDSERAWRSQTDQDAISTLKEIGVEAKIFRSEGVLPAGGQETYALKHFTPQWYRFVSEPAAPRPVQLPAVSGVESVGMRSLKDLGLPPTDQVVPVAGEREAHRLLNEFLQNRSGRYIKSLSVAEKATENCSHLGPHLKFGTISAKTIYQQVRRHRPTVSKWHKKNLDGFIGRLFWRDHFAQKLRNLPRCETESYLEAFDSVPWSQNEDHYQAWCEGKTGYPLVDAAMRCLNTTGWIPFRLRALCATFLCIDLFLPWQWGANHYMSKLMDADVAIDHWQWQSHAGVSNRKRKWFRVYNPVKSIDKIDPDGSFIRRWVPELEGVAIADLKTPECSGQYILPLVEHDEARLRSLAVLEPVKQRYQTRKKMRAS